MSATSSYVEGLKGRYSLRGDMEIEGTANGLNVFAESLRSIKREKRLPLPILSLDKVRPYDGCLTAIEIRLSDGKVKIRREGNMLVMSGAPEFMAVFADNVSFLVEQVLRSESEEVSRHCHIEYFEEHLWLDPESQAVVVTFLEN